MMSELRVSGISLILQTGCRPIYQCQSSNLIYTGKTRFQNHSSRWEKMYRQGSPCRLVVVIMLPPPVVTVLEMVMFLDWMVLIAVGDASMIFCPLSTLPVLILITLSVALLLLLGLSAELVGTELLSCFGAFAPTKIFHCQ